jgi:hypothetical protein
MCEEVRKWEFVFVPDRHIINIITTKKSDKNQQDVQAAQARMVQGDFKGIHARM